MMQSNGLENRRQHPNRWSGSRPRRRPAPLAEPYGFTSGLVIPASDQREDAISAAAVPLEVRPIALCHLDEGGPFSTQKPERG
jgi:hypothetical protein